MTKVFGIGWHKTGTSTLRRCFDVLSYDICPEEYSYPLAEAVGAGDYRFAIILARYHEAFEDSPWNYRGFYKILDATFDAKFILTVRDGSRWYRSLLRHVAIHGINRSTHLYQTVGLDLLAVDPQEAIESYHRHIESVREYFSQRPGRLLIVDWEQGDGWPQLCRFLGKPVPDRPLPHMLRYDPQTARCEDRP